MGLLLGAGCAAPGSQMGSQTSHETVRTVISGYAVGPYREPEQMILRELDGETRLLLESINNPLHYLDAPVTAMRLVNPKAPQTNLGRKMAAIALREGVQGLPNGRFYSHPRIACASFVSSVMRRAGRSGGSAAVNTLYAQVRKRHSVLVATRVSTRYTPYYRWYMPGDLLFFHRGSRLGHVEIYVGGGNTVGTSSSRLRLGVRRVGNRGFAYMSVVRIG